MEFKKAGDKLERGISFIIYGDPGVGKTTMATTFPSRENTLIISSEAGDGPLLGTGVSVYQLDRSRRLGDLEGLYKHLRTGTHEWKYIVLDNISEMETWMLRDIVRDHGKTEPYIQEYKSNSWKMDEYLTLFRDLIYQGITIVFNAWEMPMEYKSVEGVVESKTFPKLSKNLARKVSGLVDVVGHMTVNEKSQKRWLRVAPSDQYVSKSQLKGIGDEDGREGWEEPNFTTILEKLYAYDYKEKK